MFITLLRVSRRAGESTFDAAPPPLALVTRRPLIREMKTLRCKRTTSIFSPLMLILDKFYTFSDIPDGSFGWQFRDFLAKFHSRFSFLALFYRRPTFYTLLLECLFHASQTSCVSGTSSPKLFVVMNDDTSEWEVFLQSLYPLIVLWTLKNTNLSLIIYSFNSIFVFHPL